MTTETTKFAITTKTNGIFMGTYEGATEEDAILAYSIDAGYESIAQAAGVCGKSVEDYIAEIEIAEVEG